MNNPLSQYLYLFKWVQRLNFVFLFFIEFKGCNNCLCDEKHSALTQSVSFGQNMLHDEIPLHSFPFPTPRPHSLLATFRVFSTFMIPRTPDEWRATEASRRRLERTASFLPSHVSIWEKILLVIFGRCAMWATHPLVCELTVCIRWVSRGGNVNFLEGTFVNVGLREGAELLTTKLHD